MREYYADLHVHIGRTGAGAPVKVTASRSLTLPAVLQAAAGEKGLDLIGIVDMAVPGVLEDVRRLLDEGTLQAGDGVLHYRGPDGFLVGVLAGSEVEVTCGPGRAHFLAYLPGLEACGEFSRWVAAQVANPHLSTPHLRGSFWDLREEVSALGGLLVAAHIFTPHRGLLGACGDDPGFLRDIIAACDGVELGLSADGQLAGLLPRLKEKPWLSASDAHSVAKIAREYVVFRFADVSFRELALALAGRAGRRVAANYGLDPRLGKYHRTFCPRCGEQAGGPPPAVHCPRDPAHPVVRGVLDRIVALSKDPRWGEDIRDGRHRYPSIPYYHQVPLEFVPGIGPRTFRRLMERFGNEMTVLHRARVDELAEVVGLPLAVRIDEARRGKAAILPGGGGTYGRLRAAADP